MTNSRIIEAVIAGVGVVVATLFLGTLGALARSRPRYPAPPSPAPCPPRRTAGMEPGAQWTPPRRMTLLGVFVVVASAIGLSVFGFMGLIGTVVTGTIVYGIVDASATISVTGVRQRVTGNVCADSPRAHTDATAMGLQDSLA